MDINKFTEKAQEGLLAAQQLAQQLGNPEVQPEHLLTTLIEQADGIVRRCLASSRSTPPPLARRHVNSSPPSPRFKVAPRPRCRPDWRPSPTPRSARPTG